MDLAFCSFAILRFAGETEQRVLELIDQRISHNAYIYAAYFTVTPDDMDRMVTHCDTVIGFGVCSLSLRRS